LRPSPPALPLILPPFLNPVPPDLVITHALEWPSLTVQWLPVRYAGGLRWRARAPTPRRAPPPTQQNNPLNKEKPSGPPNTTTAQGEKEVVPGQDYSKQRLILGTHTSDNEQNYLMLAEVG
jgi:histone-binding protein RBBP4